MRKKLFVRVLSVLFIILMVSSAFCACAKSTSANEEDKVRKAVQTQGFIEGGITGGVTIGGKEINASLTRTSTTTLKKVSSTEYTAYGTITMTDVYGTHWTNQFTCTVIYDTYDKRWEASEFEYINKNWSKS